MKLQDKLDGIASTAFERKVIRIWLRDAHARSSIVRAVGEATGTRQEPGGNATALPKPV